MSVERITQRYRIEVDLTGSTKLPDSFLAVECIVDWAGYARDIRQLAADHYGVPLWQITQPVPVPSDSAKARRAEVRL